MNGPALANGFEGQHGLLVGAALRLPLKRLCYRRRRCSPWLCAPRQGCCRSERSLYLTRRRHSPRLASPVTAPVMMMLSPLLVAPFVRSEEHTSELQSLMRISYAVFCLKKKKKE